MNAGGTAGFLTSTDCDVDVPPDECVTTGGALHVNVRDPNNRRDTHVLLIFTGTQEDISDRTDRVIDAEFIRRDVHTCTRQRTLNGNSPDLSDVAHCVISASRHPVENGHRVVLIVHTGSPSRLLPFGDSAVEMGFNSQHGNLVHERMDGKVHRVTGLEITAVILPAAR